MSEKSLLCHILKAVYKGMLSYYHNGTVPQWVPDGDLLGDLGPPFLYFRLLEVFAQNWVPFWSPFLEFSGPLDILEQCNGRDFNNECFQSIVIVKMVGESSGQPSENSLMILLYRFQNSCSAKIYFPGLGTFGVSNI